MTEERLPKAVEQLLERVRRDESGSASNEPVDDLTWARSRRALDARDRPWLEDDSSAISPRDPDPAEPAARTGPRFASWHAAAAGLLLIATLGWFLSLRSSGPSEPAGVVRGATLEALAPVGAAQSSDSFRWRFSNPLPVRFTVQVRHKAGAEEIWRGVADGGRNTLALPRLDSGALLEWRVVAELEGEPTASSDWVEFFVEAENGN